MRPSEIIENGWCQNTLHKDANSNRILGLDLAKRQFEFNPQSVKSCIMGAIGISGYLNRHSLNDFFTKTEYLINLNLLQIYMNIRVYENKFSSLANWQDMETIKKEDVLALALEAESLILDNIPCP